MNIMQCKYRDVKYELGSERRSHVLSFRDEENDAEFMGLVFSALELFPI